MMISKNEILDEILGNEAILINDALRMIRKELPKFAKEVQKEIEEELKYSLENEN